MDEVKVNRNFLLKEDLLEVLDRTINFVNSCDNKAAIMLGVHSVILTIILTSDGTYSIINIFNKIIEIKEKSINDFLYMLLLVLSSITLIWGLYKIVSVLIAKVDCRDLKSELLEMDSKIFFGNIAKNKSYKEYKQKLLSIEEDEFINDIISQIYLNSIICDNKFKRYNLGVLLSIAGLIGFIIVLIMGAFIYL